MDETRQRRCHGGTRIRSAPKPRDNLPVRNQARCEPDDADESSPDYSPCRSPTSPWFSGARSSAQGCPNPPTFSFTGESVKDEFDEFLYKSKHICSVPNEPQYSTIHLPPEVNIEVPSDSDSSRRPSKASYGSFSYCSSVIGSNSGSVQNVPLGVENENFEQDQAIKAAAARTANSYSKTKRKSIEQDSSRLLASRPLLDRRSSHSGVVRPQVTTTRCVNQPPKEGHRLAVPHARSRGSSLPGNFDLAQQVDVYRLRNFTLEGKRVVNRGDSLKMRSNMSINSTESSMDMRNTSPLNSPKTHSGEEYSQNDGSSLSSRYASRSQSRRGSFAVLMDQLKSGLGRSEKQNRSPSPPRQYRVAMLGATGVGKSALTSQFLTSDHINTYDPVEDDDVQKSVSLCVDGKEAQLIFIDHAHTDMSIENLASTYAPNGYMVVYAVNDPETLEVAEEILKYLKKERIIKTLSVILIANKTDLVRSRVVSKNNGKSLAVKYGCKYIETSPGINHNIDELLVGMLSQIKLREDSKVPLDKESDDEKGGSFKGFKMLDKILGRASRQEEKMKSCGDLHIL